MPSERGDATITKNMLHLVALALQAVAVSAASIHGAKPTVLLATAAGKVRVAHALAG